MTDPSRRIWLRIAAVAALGAASLMSACGQKGPLYLPERSASGQTQVS